MKNKTKYSWRKLKEDCDKIIEKLIDYEIDTIVIISRGGLVLGGILSNKLNIQNVYTVQATSYKEMIRTTVTVKNFPEIRDSKILLVDDIVDTGDTLSVIKRRLERNDNKVITAVIHKSIDKKHETEPDIWIRDKDKWVVYPWE